MKKSHILIVVSTLAIGAVLNFIISKQSKKHREALIRDFIKQRDQLEENCDRINGAARKLPSAPTTESESQLCKTVNEAIIFTNSIFRFCHLDEPELDQLPYDLLYAFYECMRTSLHETEKHLAKIEDAFNNAATSTQ